MDESNFDKQIKLLQDEAIRAKMFVNEISSTVHRQYFISFKIIAKS